MRCDLFIKGCLEQLNWLCYCLQFIEKNWQHKDSRIVVVLDRNCEEIVAQWGVKVQYIFVDPWPDRYMHALWCKATADRYTDAELILLMDSDHLMVNPCGFSDLMHEGKPVIEYLRWGHESRDVARRIWPRIVKESTGLKLPVDYMIKPDWAFWRSTFAGARSLVENHRGKPFDEAVYSEAPYDWTHYEDHPFTFCDLENLALYGASLEGEKYFLWDTEKITYIGRIPRSNPIKDYWSHTPFELVRPSLDQLLGM
jgi:hypothetical protein